MTHPPTFFARACRHLAIKAVLGVMLIAMSGLGIRFHAFEVTLLAPLTTLVPIDGAVNPNIQLVATLTVPTDAPDDLGVGVYVSDQHGRWFQKNCSIASGPGPKKICVALNDAGFVSEPRGAEWNPSAVSVITKTGLFFWSASTSRSVIRIDEAHLVETPITAVVPAQLLDLCGPPSETPTGSRWTVTLRPEPFPHNPYDADEFSIDALVTLPDGTVSRIPGFYYEPMQREDRGDKDVVTPSGPASFMVRFRPRQPGVHQVSLEARWKNGATIHVNLPPTTTTGHAWDGYARPDQADPRFLSKNGEFIWPIGSNLRSAHDERSVEYLKTRVTPDRGSFTYDAYLARLAAHKVTVIEVWMSSWNLALEWRADWPPYHGHGRYSQEHAWQLDHLLDRAEAYGMTVVLVLDNHGKASSSTDHQWENNPYNAERGGRLTDASSLFTDPWAIATQAKIRRYLAARYADSPALLTWKLWSEINLTNAYREQRDEVGAWVQQAAKQFQELDSYHHPISVHWSGDYHYVDRLIANIPEINLIAIDAYHGPERSLAELLTQGMFEERRNRGLARLNKPIIITEYGGQWNGCSEPQMEAEHASGPWIGLVSGYAASPMLWWYEWIDQGERYAPYQALSRYLIGEDLRGKDAGSSPLTATGPNGIVWCRAWTRPGRVLGYAIDASWGATGGDAVEHHDVQIVISTAAAAGPMKITWWNADTGIASEPIDIIHPGGLLTITAPTFSKHYAFKLWRVK